MFYFFVWNQSIPCCAKMITVTSRTVEDTLAAVCPRTLSINMIHVIPIGLLLLLGKGDFFGFRYCQVMEMVGAIWKRAVSEKATHKGCEVAAWFLTLENHNGCIIVSLGSPLKEAESVTSWPQRSWYWSVYPESHRIHSETWRFTNT